MAAPALTNYADGVGAVNGDNLNTFVQGGVLLAQLQLFPGAWNGQVVYLGGYTSTGDGGQGFFWWNSTSTATSNGVTVIVPYGTVGYGAWLRLNDNSAGVSTFRYVTAGTSDVARSVDSTIVWKSTVTSGKTEVLPAANILTAGTTMTVKDGNYTSASYPITVTSTASTIDSNPSDIIQQNGASRSYRTDGVSNWVIV
jgi:hypothetical protein